MEGVLALLTDKEQTGVFTILLAGEAALRACLAGIVGIHLDAETASERCFVGEAGVQFGKGPCGGMPIGAGRPCRDGHHPVALAAILAPLRSLANAGQMFQTNERVWMGIQDALTDRVVGIQLTVSLAGRARFCAAWRCECLCAEGVSAGERNGPPGGESPFHGRTVPRSQGWQRWPDSVGQHRCLRSVAGWWVWGPASQRSARPADRSAACPDQTRVSRLLSWPPLGGTRHDGSIPGRKGECAPPVSGD